MKKYIILSILLNIQFFAASEPEGYIEHVAQNKYFNEKNTKIYKEVWKRYKERLQEENNFLQEATEKAMPIILKQIKNLSPNATFTLIITEILEENEEIKEEVKLKNREYYYISFENKEILEESQYMKTKEKYSDYWKVQIYKSFEVINVYTPESYNHKDFNIVLELDMDKEDTSLEELELELNKQLQLLKEKKRVRNPLKRIRELINE